MNQTEVVLFVACFFRCVRRENEVLAYFFHVSRLGEHVEGCANGMSLVQMVNFGFDAEFFEQTGSADTQKNVLGYTGLTVGVI